MTGRLIALTKSEKSSLKILHPSRHDACVNRFLLAIILSGFCLNVPRAASVDERIWINAKINGRPVRFVYDTGAGFNQVLFSITAQKLGLKIAPSDPNQKINPGRFAVGTTELCNLDFGITNARVSLDVMELPAYFKWAQEADGAVGWPALSNGIIHLDLVVPAVSLLTNVPKESLGWEKFRIPPHPEILKLEVPDDNGGTVVVDVDTGNDHGVVLHPRKWRAWKATHTNQPITLDAGYMPGAGLVVKEESFAHEISFGPLTLTEVPVMEANQAELATDPKYEASLGIVALKRLDMVIDGKQGIVYVRPQTTPPLPYQHNRLGAVFVPRDSQNDDLVAHVVDGSPAYEEGIRNDDVLLKIGELDATKWRTDPNVLPLSRFWNSPAGTKLELALKRGDKIFKTTAMLRNILPPDAPKNSN